MSSFIVSGLTHLELIFVSTCKRMNLDSYLTLYTKINSRWVRPETIKLLIENWEGTLKHWSWQ